jgi:hypothetical protein
MSKILMSGKVSGILATVAVSLSFGAVQLASGRDLAATGRDASQAQDVTSDNGINRGAKSDRVNTPRVPAPQSQTISVRLDGLAATSILIRLPVQLREEARNRFDPPALTKQPASARRSAVACEPLVSVLTEVAKQLQPGRCVT